MLSYRHAFHAGNHADVLKHVVLAQVLAYLKGKDKPFLYVDTHAGRGVYDLRSPEARRNREHESGIGSLWELADAPPGLADYLALVRQCNGPGPLRRYPGSPWLARALLRPRDRAHLFELHPAEFRVLFRRYADDRQVRVEHRDGLQGLKSVLPPVCRRAAVLIDPAYEVKADYEAVAAAVADATRRFATGVYMVWFPILEPDLSGRLLRLIEAAGYPKSMLARLEVDTTEGLRGSGMLVLNPPWGLAAAVRALARDLPGLLGGHARLSVTARDAPARNAS